MIKIIMLYILFVKDRAIGLTLAKPQEHERY